MQQGWGQLRTIADELLLLLHESAAFHGDLEIQNALLRAARELLAVRRRIVAGENRYVVAVVGLTNVGKSTLLNALLGAELTARRNGPCTAAPIEFVYGEQPRLIVHYRGDFHRPAWACANTDELHERLVKVSTGATDRDRQVDKLVVELPLEILRHQLIIADTPGFGAAQGGEAAGTHEQALKDYLERDVSQVFWIVLAEQGIGRRERSFHEKFFADICDDVVVTGCDGWEPVDLKRCRERFAESFGRRSPVFHFVSGLNGIKARAAKNEAGLEAAGIVLLEQRIRELSDPSARMDAARYAIEQLTAELSSWIAEHQTRAGRPVSSVWRPDSWSRWQVAASQTEFTRKLHADLAGER